MLHGILGCCLSCAHKYWLSTSHGIPALNDDEIELRIKPDFNTCNLKFDGNSMESS